MREITISDYKRAYELGKKHAEECDLCGWYTPFLQASYDLGYEGIEVDFSKVVKAERYGDLPNGCSYNYADNKKEMGVSASNLVRGKRNEGLLYGLRIERRLYLKVYCFR